MDIFSNLTDDQLALLGCVAALVTSSGLMFVSHYIGRLRGQSSRRISDVQPQRTDQTRESRRAA